MSAEITIEKNIPIPPGRRGGPGTRGGGKWQRTVAAMNIGDSVVTNTSGYTSMSKRLREAGFGIAIRQIGKDSFRVWKIKQPA